MRAVSSWRSIVDRQHRARHVPPGKTRQDRAGEAGRIDLDDLVVAEEFVETAAEMAAGLHHHDARGGDVEAEGFEEHRVGALVAVGQDDDGDAVQCQRGGLADIQRVVGIDAAPASDRLVAQPGNHRRGGERFGEFVAAATVEAGLEAGAEALLRALRPPSAGSWMTPTRAPLTPAAWKACRIAMVLPRPPPPGLSATSAKISGVSVVVASRTASSRLVRVGRNWSRRAQPASAISFAKRIGGVLVGGGDHDGQAVERGVGEGKAAHDRDVQDAPGVRRFGHALLAEVDQFAVWPVRCVLAGKLGDRRRHDRQPDAGEKGAGAAQQAAKQRQPPRRRARACRDADWCGSRRSRSAA